MTLACLHTGNIGGLKYSLRLILMFDVLVPMPFPRINEEWKRRWSAKLGTGRRMDKKRKPAIQQVEENIWKSKPSQTPSNLFGVGQLGKPGVQRGGMSLSTSITNSNVQKGFNNLKRRQLLDFLGKTQPSSIMWDKAWKYSKPLPSPEEGAPLVLDWGKCWMLATRQPRSEDGKTWLNGPNTMDPHSLCLWNKSDHTLERSQRQNANLPAEQWGTSWKKYDKSNNKSATTSNEYHARSELVALLDEAQRNNEEWIKSWRSIKPASQPPNDSHTNDFVVNRQETKEEISSDLDCWRLVNHHGAKQTNSNGVQKSCSPDWADSWRVATVVTSSNNDSGATTSSIHKETFSSSCQQQRDPQFHKVLHEVKKLKCRSEHLVSRDESKLLSEWANSWQVAKNNSKPCAEIEKVLKASHLRSEANLKEERNGNRFFSGIGKNDHGNQQLHSEIYQPKRGPTKTDTLYKKQLDKVSSALEWRESWKVLKSRRMEKGRVRNDPLKSLGSFDRGRQAELADMWKCTSLPLRQEPEAWQQHWPTVAPVRVNRARHLNHFAPVELPKNGPTGESIYGASWKCFSPQHRPSPGRGHHQGNRSNCQSVRHRGFAGAVADWQGAWSVSNSQAHHDRPYWTEWGEAWRWSLLNTPNWVQEVSANELDEVMEIRAERKMVSTTMIRSPDTKVFQEKCPEEQWRSSWRVSPLLAHQQSPYGSSEMPVSSVPKQQHTTSDLYKTKWGLPFRLANPMPHMEQPWVESPSNICHYAVMWARKADERRNLNIISSTNGVVARLWANSHQFLQGTNTNGAQKGGCKEFVNPMVIVRKKSKAKGHFFSKMEKQSERKWAGCHLLGKTQPRPKRGPGSFKKLDVEDGNKFKEEWAESWRYLVVKMQTPTKSLSGWVESWKFLIPLYKPMNGLKAK